MESTSTSTSTSTLSVPEKIRKGFENLFRSDIGELYIESGKKGEGKFPIIDLVGEFEHEYPYRRTLLMKDVPSEKDLEYLCQIGDLKTLKLLVKKGFTPGREGLKKALEYGQLEVIKWMNRLQGWLPCPSELSFAIKNGHMNILLWALEKGVEPNPFSIYKVIKFKRYDILNWLLEIGVELPNLAADVAAENGDIRMLEELAGLTPPKMITSTGTYRAAEQGRLNVFNWLDEHHWEIHGIPVPTPDVEDMKAAVLNGHLEIMNWIEAHFPAVVPNISVANAAAEGGHIEILNILRARDPLLVPNRDGADLAAGNGHSEILDWLEKLVPPVFPTVSGATDALANGHIPILDRLEALDRPEARHILPEADALERAARTGKILSFEWAAKRGYIFTEGMANRAAKKGHLDILEFLAKQDPKVFPDAFGASLAAENGHLNILEWLERSGRSESLDQEPIYREPIYRKPIYPVNANSAAEQGHMEIVGWLARRKIYPNQRGIDGAAEYGQLDILIWAEENLGLLPTTAIEAERNNYSDVVNWLDKRGIH